MRKVTIFSAGLLALVLLVAASAQANAPRVTRGDAQAIFEAFGSGGWAVVLNGGAVEGAPADFLPGSLARISPARPWNGRHFCASDWHVINLATIDGNAEGESRTQREIREYLSQESFFYTLDGAPLDTVTTAIRRFLNPERFGFEEAYYVQAGRVMAPEDLPVGPHVLRVTILHPGQAPTVLGPITFFIDAPGTGTCL